MKVYVVTCGTYSDFHTVGIFSTKQKAEKYMANLRASKASYRGNDLNDLEIWTLDEQLKEREFNRFGCGMLLDDGEIKEQWGPQLYWGVPESKVFIHESVPAFGGRGIARAESHKSAEHAKKLAIEARQEWLRKKAQP